VRLVARVPPLIGGGPQAIAHLVCPNVCRTLVGSDAARWASWSESISALSVEVFVTKLVLSTQWLE